MVRAIDRRWWWTATVVAAVLVVVVLVWFQPQKLFIDERVDEGLPGAVADTAGAGAVASPEPEPPRGTAPAVATPSAEPSTRADREPAPSPRPAVVELSSAPLTALDHDASGIAKLVRLADGSHLIRFEDLVVENGPDLRIYLTAAAADHDPSTIDDDFVDLGALKGNLGNQNYEIPADVDVSRFRAVSVWCRRFATGFAVAPIGPPDA